VASRATVEGREYRVPPRHDVDAAVRVVATDVRARRSVPKPRAGRPGTPAGCLVAAHRDGGVPPARRRRPAGAQLSRSSRFVPAPSPARAPREFRDIASRSSCWAGGREDAALVLASASFTAAPLGAAGVGSSTSNWCRVLYCCASERRTRHASTNRPGRQLGELAEPSRTRGRTPAAMKAAPHARSTLANTSSARDVLDPVTDSRSSTVTFSTRLEHVDLERGLVQALLDRGELAFMRRAPVRGIGRASASSTSCWWTGLRGRRRHEPRHGNRRTRLRAHGTRRGSVDPFSSCGRSTYRFRGSGDNRTRTFGAPMGTCATFGRSADPPARLSPGGHDSAHGSLAASVALQVSRLRRAPVAADDSAPKSEPPPGHRRLRVSTRDGLDLDRGPGLDQGRLTMPSSGRRTSASRSAVRSPAPFGDPARDRRALRGRGGIRGP